MEYVRKCQVCGKVYCYTDADLKKSKTNSFNAGVSAIGTIASLFGGGSMLESAYLDNQTKKYDSQIVDYTKCPSCNSSRTYLVSDNELRNVNSINVSSEKSSNKNTSKSFLDIFYKALDQKDDLSSVEMTPSTEKLVEKVVDAMLEHNGILDNETLTLIKRDAVERKLLTAEAVLYCSDEELFETWISRT